MSHRSLRVDNAVTSLKLEPAFWEEIDRRSEMLGLSWQDYVRHLLEQYEQPKNRTAEIKQFLLVQLKEEKKALSTDEEIWLVSNENGTQKVITNQPRIIVGRDKTNDIVVTDKQVSRKHLLFVFDNLHWWLVDLKSKNGTYINGDVVVSKRLSRGDIVTIGNTNITKG